MDEDDFACLGPNALDCLLAVIACEAAAEAKWFVTMAIGAKNILAGYIVCAMQFPGPENSELRKACTDDQDELYAEFKDIAYSGTLSPSPPRSCCCTSTAPPAAAVDRDVHDRVPHRAIHGENF